MVKKKEIKIPNMETATLYEMFNYLCSRVDWGKSFLDSTGVQCMNELFLRLKKLE